MGRMAARPQQRPCSLQDIAALTLALYLRDLRLAQRSGACSPRPSGTGTAGIWVGLAIPLAILSLS